MANFPQTRVNKVLKQSGVEIGELEKRFVSETLNGAGITPLMGTLAEIFTKSNPKNSGIHQPTPADLENLRRKLLQRPSIRAAMALMVDEYLQSEAVPLAIGTLSGLMSTSQSEEIKLRAAMQLLDRAGYTAKRAEVQAGVTDDVRALNREQLQRKIEEIETRLGLKTIDITPNGEHEHTQELELFR